MHLNLDDSISAAGFAPSTLDIKAETSFLIAFGLGICSCRKKITDLIKNASISCRIGTWCSSNRRLVNINYLIQPINSQDIVMLSGNHPGTVQISRQSLIENLIDQGTLTRTGNTGDTGHNSQRNIHINMLQVVLGRSFDCQKSGWFLPHFRYRDLQSST